MSTKTRRGKSKPHVLQRNWFKHGGDSVMVWSCFSGQGIGSIFKINGIMDRFMYRDILQNVMLPYARGRGGTTMEIPTIISTLLKFASNGYLTIGSRFSGELLNLLTSILLRTCGRSLIWKLIDKISEIMKIFSSPKNSLGRDFAWSYQQINIVHANKMWECYTEQRVCKQILI